MVRDGIRIGKFIIREWLSGSRAKKGAVSVEAEAEAVGDPSLFTAHSVETA